jgi:L-aspartate oxidase
VTKSRLKDGSTLYAQGGIAAVLDSDDTPSLHLEDTMNAGAGLCNREAVSVLVTEGPRCVRKLMERGAQFDTDANGQLLLAREGAHRTRRIVHAQGDSTGREVMRALTAQAQASGVAIFENTFTVDLLTDDGRCVGALVLDAQGQLKILRAKATILATGGCGQVYRVTTNPPVVTGDGMAMAFRAGAPLRDMEFVQFHPTALAVPREPKFLISEAARGEGAILRNVRGERFMPRYHEMAELAPRDVVARSIVEECRRTRSDHALLDLTAHSAEFIAQRFPCIYENCVAHGFDPSQQPIPVSPAAHYMMGGVKTDTHGATEIPGLYACGEVANTGVHGANRLASNSLLEGLVFASRTVTAARRYVKRIRDEGLEIRDERMRMTPHPSSLISHPFDVCSALQNLMWQHAGILRDGEGLSRARRQILEWMERLEQPLPPTPVALELANMLTVASLITHAASLRTESRGAHSRQDFPQREDAWLNHVVLQRQLKEEGTLEATADVKREA